MATPSWLPMLNPSIGIIVLLCAFMWQIHRARFNQSIDLLFRQETDFFGPAKKAQRVRASEGLLQGKSLEAEPILDFFETMALLLRRGALDREMVWHTFFYWADHYYEACRETVVERQTREPLVWKDFTEFVLKLRNFQTAQPGGSSYRPPSRDEVERFLREELTEAA